LRELRRARALTQAQLAGQDFTSGFISLLEGGQTRASLRAAEILARRLGVAVRELLEVPATRGEHELELELFAAQKLLADGDLEAARRAAGVAAEHSRGTLRARWLRLHGQALLRLDRARDAINSLDQARRAFRSLPDPELTARTTYELAQAHAALGEFAEAVGLASECERLLDSRVVVDRTLEFQVMNFLAAMFIDLGEVGAADLRAERALTIAKDVSDLSALAHLYAGLSITRQQQGDFEAALSAARKSLEAYERLGQQRGVAEAWNTLAWLYVQRKQLARAREALETARRLALAAKYDRLTALLNVTGAELALARRQFPEAIALVDLAIKDPAASAYGRAEALFVRAQAIVVQRPTLAVVRRVFDAAVTAAESQPARRRAKVHQAYARELAARKRYREAHDQDLAALACFDPRPI
jgi:tetratricopeptide (TPR) repeat protein